VKLSPRRNAEEPAEVVEEASARPGAKGRPTPKRRDVAGQRGPVKAPQSRKEAYARQKQQAREARAARGTPAASMTAAQRRAAMRSGEILPRRDQGATRKIARDYVDAHRMFSNYLLLLFPLMIVSYAVRQAWILQTVVFAIFFGILVEWYLVGRRIRAMSVERTGSAQGGAMSIGFYAGSRAYLPRRWRMPSPQVERGDTI
jgi:hypothetical protein